MCIFFSKNKYVYSIYLICIDKSVSIEAVINTLNIFDNIAILCLCVNNLQISYDKIYFNY